MFSSRERSGGSKGGAGDTHPPLLVQILSISCSFWENLAKSYVGAPPEELAPPPRGNPRSAAGACYFLTTLPATSDFFSLNIIVTLYERKTCDSYAGILVIFHINDEEQWIWRWGNYRHLSFSFGHDYLRINEDPRMYSNAHVEFKSRCWL